MSIAPKKKITFKAPAPAETTEEAELDSVERLGLEYLEHKSDCKDATAAADEIRETLEPLVRKVGVRDVKGGCTVVTPSVTAAITIRETPTLSADAENVLSELGLLADAQTQVTVLDAVKIEGLHASGRLSTQDLARILHVKKVEAFTVKRT